MEKAKNLLKIVDILKSKYDKLSKTNTGFNIFTVLRQEDDEVNLHSKFIVELLSNIPHYSEKYRKLFFENIGIEDEYFQGDIQVLREHRNIDILLRDEDKIIIIENKIYAEDQGEQLSRYYKLMKNRSNEIKIFYLTLDGRDPSDQSLGDILCSESDHEEGKVQVINLSYKENISSWLEECIKESATVPIIRETLVQYLEVVNRLTGKTESKDFYNEMAAILGKSSNNMQLANDIKVGLDLASNRLRLNFWQELEIRLKENSIYGKFIEKYSVNNNEKYSKEKIKNNKKNYGLMYSIAKLNETDELMLILEIDHYFYWGYGIMRNDQVGNYCDEDKFKELKSLLHSQMNKYSDRVYYVEKQANEWWLVYAYPEPDINYRFPNEEFFKLADKDYRDNRINEIVNVVSEITGGIIKETINFLKM